MKVDIYYSYYWFVIRKILGSFREILRVNTNTNSYEFKNKTIMQLLRLMGLFSFYEK